ncbi:transcription factor BIM1-like isoform X2 [Primulina huaijiensis]|uniref:transcription factor BIM1-like isoform X2 n=1 Tax=Primulina huaijiensis TaxID=1492673 RepID=UPI003CC7143E
MELPRPRAYETEGGKATQDFLSLYSSSSPVQQDPTPQQGGYLETHDFLRPLERVGNNETKEGNKVEMSVVNKLPPPAAEHLLPGGNGTYSISYFNQRGLKPEGEGSLYTMQASSATRNDDNSNSSSHTGSGFTLWNESAVNKGKTGKENFSAQRHVLEEGLNMVGGQWIPALERPSQSSSNNKHNTTTLGSFSSSQPASSQKNHSFMSMIKSAENDQKECDDDDKAFIMKKVPSFQPKGNLSVKIEARTIDQKPNTPRSKHSATEQRRRSKINDRFQNLREIVPNSDQKRDKASFLLEVIEYIQFLQEKVKKYESSYSVWNHETSKIIQRRNCHMGEGVVDHSQWANAGSGPASALAARFEENKSRVSPAMPINGQNLVESDTSTATTFKEKAQQPELTSKAAPVHPPIQPSIFDLGRTSAVASPLSLPQASDLNKTTSWIPSHVLQNRSCTDYWTRDKLKDQNLAIESGTISISSAYSQRLLSTLTLALQESGIDLSKSSISVQIDLGKRSNSANSSTSAVKDNVPRDACMEDEFGQALKRLKTI